MSFQIIWSFPKWPLENQSNLIQITFSRLVIFFRVNIFTRKGREFFLYWAIAVNSPNNCTGGGGGRSCCFNQYWKQTKKHLSLQHEITEHARYISLRVQSCMNGAVYPSADNPVPRNVTWVTLLSVGKVPFVCAVRLTPETIGVISTLNRYKAC